jgi:hypothetical protein
MFLRNVGWHSTYFTALYLRRWYSSKKILFTKRVLKCSPAGYRKGGGGTPHRIWTKNITEI